MLPRRRLAIGIAGLATVAAVGVPLGLTSGGGSVDVFVGSTPTPTATATPVSCDSTVTTRAALVTALGNTGNAGKTVCVTASITGASITVSTTMATQARFIAQPADGTIDMVSLAFGTSQKITVEGFEFTGDHGVDMGNSTHIHYIRNRCHDQELDCIDGNGATDINDTWILGNSFERITYDGNFGNGYPIQGRNFDNLRIEYNFCDGGSDGTVNIQSDCLEIDNAEDFTFIGNDIIRDACSDCGLTHTDGFMFWNGSDRGTIQDNRVLDSAQTTLSPDGSDMLVDNNLIARMQGTCLDVHPNGSSGDVQPLRFTFSNNTVWDCGFSAWTMNGALAGRGSNVVTDNLFDDGGCTASGLTTATGNVIGSGGNPCSWSSGTNSFGGFTPTWGGTDVGDDATYQATNLPVGYTGAGYRPAPLGPDGCSC